MIRSILFACSLALLATTYSPQPGCADEQVAAATDASEKPEGREQWRAKLLAANQEVARAEKRNAAALRAYESMRHRRHPRGEGKRLILEELEISREELATAQQKLEKIEKAARRAGAPPSWLRFDPAEIDAPVPASTKP